MKQEFLRGLIFDIERFAIHDGPGIRTVVFFKGCDLDCIWCQNPEGKIGNIEIYLDKSNCTKCGKCEETCPVNKIIISNDIEINRISCPIECFLCVEKCPTSAIKQKGKYYTLNELLEIVIKDKPFFGISGGGVTLSGGEPLLQVKFVRYFLKLLKEENINVTVETAGFVEWENIETVLSYTDIIYYDLKIFNQEIHKKYTAHSNRLILENLNKLFLRKKNLSILIRIPLIPHITDTKQNLMAISNFLSSNFGNYLNVELLPYNYLVEAKFRNMVCIKGKKLKQFPLSKVEKQDTNELLKMKDIFARNKIKVKVLSID